ncbi:MAG: hypothetical protein RQ750_09510 [Roseovarius sp.]|nr:hypothetical protein [Roseovarius sp.]
MENITQLQQDLLDRLKERDKIASVRWNDERGVAAVITGHHLSRDRVASDLEQDPEAVLKAFLKEYGPLIGPENTTEAMRFVGFGKTRGKHICIRAMQVAGGLAIHGASLILFADPERGVFRA